VGVHRTGSARAETLDHLDELALLTETAGGVVAGRIVQERARFDAATLIGKGKAHEIASRVKAEKIDLVIFDDELQPAQIRNLEKIIGAAVIDRAALILDIFAGRARTREARTQVELAQLEYLLPRLTRQWQHLSRQAGGTIGLKGVGETQLELDRRLIRRRIAHLRLELAKVERSRKERRRGREGVFRAALVGYTNAGKSTLFNALAAAGAARVEDRLFATLDPLIRRGGTASTPYLLVDTVGFIRKLPHDLVASFRSTLEESADSELILHVVDLAQRGVEARMAVTDEVLAGLGLRDRPTMVVFNKSDRAEAGAVERMESLYPDALIVSAVRGDGVAALARAIAAAARRSRGSEAPTGRTAAAGGSA